MEEEERYAKRSEYKYKLIFTYLTMYTNAYIQKRTQITYTHPTITTTTAITNAKMHAQINEHTIYS